MIGRAFRVATIFGIPIRIDASWLVIVVLVTTGLSVEFGAEFPYLSWPARLFIGVSGALLLFGSVLAHELSHAVVALRAGIPMRGITLFIFGGAAEMLDEPSDPGVELRVALAGPAMSLALAIGFGGLYAIGLGRVPPPLLALARYLAFINAILLVFNLVPGFPLDGGRVLRALLWGIWRNLRAATQTASAVGSGFGGLIMVLGFFQVFGYRNVVAGIWYILIGFFLRSAARGSYQQMLVKDYLSGIRARDLMNDRPVAVPASMSVAELVERVVLGSGLTAVPVVDEDGRLVGIVELADLRAIPRARWPWLSAGEIAARRAPRRLVGPDEEATRLLAAVTERDELVPVVEDGRLVGVVSRDDMMRRLRVLMELAGRRG